MRPENPRDPASQRERPEEEGPAATQPQVDVLRDSQSGSEMPLSGTRAIERMPERVGPYRPVRILGRGGMGVVYEAVHGTGHHVVALKMAFRDSERSLARLRAEIEALQRVSHPGVVRLIDHGTDDGVPFYAMDLLIGETWQEYSDRIWRPDNRGAAEKRARAANGKLSEVLRRACGLAESLGFLHGLGLVHCDVSPRNVFVLGDGTTVLVDLGLVSRHRGAVGRELLEATHTPAGTRGYMAPERILGLSVDARADLYSLGALLHMTLTGRPPSLHGWAAPSTFVSDVPPAIDSLVEQLLRSNRSERPLAAIDVVNVLGSVDGHRISPQTATSNRLFRSRVFGRDDVLHTLSQAVHRAETAGSFMLVAGESGIGKTAVASMVARVAAMDGMQVLTGECIPFDPTYGRDGAGVRGPHFSPLRPLLHAALDRALSQRQPALTKLLESLAAYDAYQRRVSVDGKLPSDSPIAAGQLATTQICEQVAALLSLLARSTPVLLILDDLQWGDELTMTFLISLPSDYFECNRVVLVAAYRTEETGDLLRQLSARPYVETLVLAPLGERAVGDMVSESLGCPIPDPWVRAFHGKSRGNPFLVAEYLRAALDERVLVRDGRSAMTTPAAETFVDTAGSIDELIRRRLGRLSPDVRRLLELSAVIGNPIPRDLLAQTSDLLPEPLDDSIDDLIGRNLLEGIRPEQHRFMHDKLREVTYAGIDVDVRRRMHRRVGCAIERRVPGAAEKAAAAPVLAHHFARAGERERAVFYLELAAEVAHHSFANHDVVALLTEAVSLLSADDKREREQLARWHFRLGTAHFGLGSLAESRAHLVRMLELVGFPLPARAVAAAWQCVVEVGRQVVCRVFGTQRATASARRTLLDAALAHDMLMQVYFYRGDSVVRVIHAAVASLNLSERAGPSPELRLAYANAQATSALFGLRRIARRYEVLGSAAESDDDDIALRTASLVRQCTQHIVWAEWDAAEGRATRIIEEARSLRYGRREEEGISLLAYVRFAQGRFDECRVLYDHLHGSAARGDAQSLCWSVVFRGHTDLVQDRSRSAVKIATEGLGLVAQLPGRSEAINVHSILAAGFLRLGNDAEAERHGRTALSLGRSASLVVFLDIVAYSHLAEVFHGLAARRTDKGVGAESRLAREALRQLDRCARIFPIATPKAALWRGVGHWQAGRVGRARASWKRALSAARRLGMPYDQTHAELLLGTRGGSVDGREAALCKAEEAFRALGAAFDERRTGEERRPARPLERST